MTRLPIDRLPSGQRLRIEHGGLPVELLRDGEQLTARLMVCTHQYCVVYWIDWEDNYNCPCHGAKFDADGAPKAGPVSEPLVEVPARIEGAEVVVGGAPTGSSPRGRGDGPRGSTPGGASTG